jgi:anti-anti-sigma factor
VSVSGELVGRSCERVVYLARVAAEAGAAAVRVNARSVTYAGSDGVRALLEARAEAERNGARFVLEEPSPSLQRVLVVLGLDPLFSNG